MAYLLLALLVLAPLRAAADALALECLVVPKAALAALVEKVGSLDAALARVNYPALREAAVGKTFFKGAGVVEWPAEADVGKYRVELSSADGTVRYHLKLVPPANELRTLGGGTLTLGADEVWSLPADWQTLDFVVLVRGGNFLQK